MARSNIIDPNRGIPADTGPKTLKDHLAMREEALEKQLERIKKLRNIQSSCNVDLDNVVDLLSAINQPT